MFEKLGKTKITPTQAPATVTVPAGPDSVGTKEIIGVVKTRQKNVIERVAWTAGQAFVGALLASLAAADTLGLDAGKAAALAGGSAALAAIVALVKNIVATRGEG